MGRAFSLKPWVDVCYLQTRYLSCSHQLHFPQDWCQILLTTLGYLVAVLPVLFVYQSMTKKAVTPEEETKEPQVTNGKLPAILRKLPKISKKSKA